MKRLLTLAILVVLHTVAYASPLALHVIGVHEGQFDQKAFSAKCADKQEVTSNSEAPPAPHTLKLLSPECTDIQQSRTVAVTITDNSKPIVLALNAYNRTLWKISLKPGVKLQKIILSGYHSQQISGIPEKTPVETYTYEPSPCKQCWQGAEHFYSYEHPPEELRKITGLEITSFQGRYTGSEFFIFPGMKKF